MLFFVCLFSLAVVGADDDAAAPVRDQGNFENTRLNPVNLAVPFAVTTRSFL